MALYDLGKSVDHAFEHFIKKVSQKSAASGAGFLGKGNFYLINFISGSESLIRNYLISETALRYQEDCGYLISDQINYLLSVSLPTAISFHAGHPRKLTDPKTNRKRPYVFHPLEVALSSQNASFITISAMLNHDTIEESINSIMKEYSAEIEKLAGKDEKAKERHVRVATSLLIGIYQFFNLEDAANREFISDKFSMYQALYSQMRCIESLTHEKNVSYYDYLTDLGYGKHIDEKWDDLKKMANDRNTRMVLTFLADKYAKTKPLFSNQISGNILEHLEDYSDKILHYSKQRFVSKVSVSLRTEHKNNIRRSLKAKFRDIGHSSQDRGTFDDFGPGDRLLDPAKYGFITNILYNKLNKTTANLPDFSNLLESHADAMGIILRNIHYNIINLRKTLIKEGLSKEFLEKISMDVIEYPKEFKFGITDPKFDDTYFAGVFFRKYGYVLKFDELSKFFKKFYNLENPNFSCVSPRQSLTEDKKMMITLSAYSDMCMWHSIFHEWLHERNVLVSKHGKDFFSLDIEDEKWLRIGGLEKVLNEIGTHPDHDEFQRLLIYPISLETN